MKTIGTIVLMVAVAIVAGAMVYWFAPGRGGGGTTIVTVDEIKKIAELAAVKYHLSVTKYHPKPPVGLEWLPAKLFVTVKGNIKGSVDLKAAKIEIPKAQNDKVVRITFPKGAVVISSPEIGAQDVTFLECANPNPFHPLNDQDYTAAEKEAIDMMMKVATDSGIESETVDEAKLILGTFLAGLGFEAEITFEDTEMNAALPSDERRMHRVDLPAITANQVRIEGPMNIRGADCSAECVQGSSCS